MRWPFGRYLDDVLVPFWNDRDPTLDRDALIRDADLRSIESFLAEAPHVAVMTNADDFIMTPGDLEFLRTTFGSRATIFPTGGHCGNLQHRDTVAAMLEFFGAGR